MSDSMRVIGLSAENFKRLRAVELRPRPGLNVIAGRNAQGKSSILDSIEAGLGGAKSCPSQPIRQGANRADVVLDLGDIRVTRTWTGNGSRLTVTDAGGGAVKSPQTVLDELAQRITFDPMEFARLKPAEQARLLRELVGLDTSDIDAKAGKLEPERKALAASLKTAKAAYSQMPHHDDAPPAVVCVTALAQELTAVYEADREIIDAVRAVEVGERGLARAQQNVAQIEEQLAKAREQVIGYRDGLDIANRKLADLQSRPKADPAAIQVQIANAETANRKLAANNARLSKAAEVADLEGRLTAAQTSLEDLAAEKRRRLEDAAFPLDGLAVSDDCVIYRGVPLEQASQAERIRVGCAIGAALHPKLKVVLVREGSHLDDDAMDALDAWCAETGMQAWVEVVGDRPGGVVIEDGRVAAESEAEPESPVALIEN